MTSGTERSDPRTKRRVRLAYLVSHPIQYQAPLLRRIAEEPEIDLTVFFGSDFSVRGYRDEGFGVGVKWDIPLLDGYRHEFLPKLRDRGTVSVASPLNYGIVSRLRGEGGDAAFDALWVHGYSTVNAMHGIVAAKALGIPVLLRAEPWLGDRGRSGVRLAIKRAMFAGLKRMVDGVLPIGRLNAEYWRTLLRRRGRTVSDALRGGQWLLCRTRARGRGRTRQLAGGAWTGSRAASDSVCVEAADRASTATT